MKRTIILMLTIIMATMAEAERVTPEQALEQARSFIQQREAAGTRARKAPGTAAPELTMTTLVSGLYVFNVAENGGFVIVSNDDRTTPILGYSDSGSIDPDNMPDNMRAWLQGYADQIAWIIAHNITTTAAAARGTAPRRTGENYTKITPLLSTKWDQDTPYNSSIPSGYATGCVATAMAQVMYYTEIKAGNATTTTTKEIPGYTSTRNSVNMSAIPAGTTIDWSSMKPSYKDGYTTAEAQAVANLMLYCGCSLKMDYGFTSKAHVYDIATALKEYFDYSSTTTKYVSRSFYSYANWIALIYHELEQGRPVIYGGSAIDNAHAFVCDGYEGDDYFYINWGWGGTADGYFQLSVLNPDQQGIGGSATSSAYTFCQDAVVGIQKTGGTGTVLNVANNVNITINSISLSSNHIRFGETISITLNVTNSSADEFDGDIVFAINNSVDYGTNVVIPANTTQDCVITYMPLYIGQARITPLVADGTGKYITNNTAISAVLTVDDTTPTNLTATNITWNSAIIGWTVMGTDTKWQLRYRPLTATNEPAGNWETFSNITNNPVTMSGLSDGCTYEVQVLADFGIRTTGWSESLIFTTPNNKPVDLAATLLTPASATISWTSVGEATEWSLRHRPVTYEDFNTTEARIQAKGWTTYPPNIQYNWGIMTGAGIDGSQCFASPSYYNGQDLNPTNWLITPKITLGGSISFYAWGEGERFIVYYSADGTNYSSISQLVTATNVATRYTLDLSEYSGTGWLAIIHCNSSGHTANSFLYVDNVTIVDPTATWTVVNDISTNPYTLRGLQADSGYEVQLMATDNGGSDWSAPVSFATTADYTLTLADNDSQAATKNSELIAAWHGITANVTLNNRTLYHDGGWNTLCLPFALTAEQLANNECPLHGAIIKTLTAATLSNGTLTLDFSKSNENAIEAGKPYIVKWNTNSSTEHTNPVFSGVTIDATAIHNIVSTAATFTGTYAYTAYTSEQRSILFLGSGSQLFFPQPTDNSTPTIGAFRAYFQLADGITADEPNGSGSIRAFSLHFGDDGSAGVKEIDDLTIDDLRFDNGTYTLGGRKIVNRTREALGSSKNSDNHKLPKGIYIHRGKKIVVN